MAPRNVEFIIVPDMISEHLPKLNPCENENHRITTAGGKSEDVRYPSFVCFLLRAAVL